MSIRRSFGILFLFILAVGVATAVSTRRLNVNSGPAPLTQMYPAAIPTSTADVIVADVSIVNVTLTNTTSSAISVTISDKQTSPQDFISAASIPGNSTIVVETPSLRFMPGGITWSATGAGIVGYVSWR